jgi:hypothetical protein
MHTVLIIYNLKVRFSQKNLRYSKLFLQSLTSAGRQRKRSVSRIGFGPGKKGSQENRPGQNFEKGMLGGAVIHNFMTQF